MPSGVEVAAPVQPAALPVTQPAALVVAQPAAVPLKRKAIYALGQFFQDTDGKPSATRLVMILWALGTFAVWAYVSIKTVTLTSLPDSVVEILGIVLTGKVVQKFGENPPSGS